MASLLASGNSKHATLVASVVDIVTLDRAYLSVEVVNRHATADLWVTVDYPVAGVETSITPTVGGDGCWYIGPGGVRVIADDQMLGGTNAPASVVRLISASAVPYSVTGMTA